MLRLRNEGPLQPAPRLKGFAEAVSRELQLWSGILAATHWKLGDSTRVDGAEFHVESGGELGHIHLNGEVHVALTRELRAALISQGLARPFVYDAAWVTTLIQSELDGQHAAWLFRLAYDRLTSCLDDVLVQRIKERGSDLTRNAMELA